MRTTHPLALSYSELSPLLDDEFDRDFSANDFHPVIFEIAALKQRNALS